MRESKINVYLLGNFYRSKTNGFRAPGYLYGWKKHNSWDMGLVCTSLDKKKLPLETCVLYNEIVNYLLDKYTPIK